MGSELITSARPHFPIYFEEIFTGINKVHVLDHSTACSYGVYVNNIWIKYIFTFKFVHDQNNFLPYLIDSILNILPETFDNRVFYVSTHILMQI